MVPAPLRPETGELRALLAAGLLGVEDALQGVLAKTVVAEDRRQRIVERKPDEEPQHASFERLVGQVLEQKAGGFVGVGRGVEAEVQDLEGGRTDETDRGRAVGGLDETNDLSFVFDHVEEGLVVKGRQNRGEGLADERPELHRAAAGGLRELPATLLLDLLDSSQIAEVGGPNGGAHAVTSRRNSRWRRRSPLSSG